MENTFKINPTIKNVEVFESLLTIPQPGQSSVALPRDEGKEQLRGVCCSSKNKPGVQGQGGAGSAAPTSNVPTVCPDTAGKSCFKLQDFKH